MVNGRLHYVCLAGGQLGPCLYTQHEEQPNGRWLCVRCGARWRAQWPVIAEFYRADVASRFYLWSVAVNLPLNALPLRTLPNDLIDERGYVRREHLDVLR